MHDGIMKVISKYAHTKRTSNKLKGKRNKKSWMTSAILKSIKAKISCLKTFLNGQKKKSLILLEI